MRKLLSFIVMLVMSMTMLMAQNKTVTGVVTSAEDGEPVIGASVIVPGTSIGTVTDIDGQFSLKVPENAKTLRVTFVGMEAQDVKISPKMSIVLGADNEILDEVMVVAFGAQKKSSFTGSAAVVDSKNIDKHVTTNVANTLVGSVPGLQIRSASGAPGASQGDIYIRGIGSMYATASPLIIVDGSPYTASLSNIPAQDIESVTVLKDAASAALYGARGAAGVILVTTKKGNSSDAKITFDAKWGANTRSVPRYDVIEDAGEYYEAQYASYYNYYRNAMGLDLTNSNLKANQLMLKNLGYNTYKVPEGQQLIGIDGKLNPSAVYGNTYDYKGETYYLTGDDWNKEAYRTATRQEYNLTVAGGSDKASFYASASYLNENGIIDPSGYERIAARLKADYQARKWLKVGANVSYTNSKTTSNPNISSSSSNETNPAYFTTYIAPIYPIYIRKMGANGRPYIATDEFGNLAYDYSRTEANSFPGTDGVRAFLSGNPLGANYYNKSTSAGNQLNGTFNIDANITSFLKFSMSSNVIWGLTQRSGYGTKFYGPKVSVGGELELSNTNGLRTNNTQTLTFFKDFGKHSVNALIGHEYYHTSEKYLMAQGQGIFTEEVLELNAAAKKADNGSYTTKYNVEGYFGNIMYNYDEKYYLQGSYRRDATSRFYKDNRWGNFWSVGGAWMLSKEKFMEPTENWLDQLKLKFSIGQQGNDGIGNFRYTDLYVLNPASDYVMSPSFDRKGNDKITWETTTNTNFGLEFSLFKGRLTGSFDYYIKTIDDLLFPVSVPLSSGYDSYYDNIGSIQNRGFEITLMGTLYRNKDWNVSMNFNGSHNYAEIKSLSESVTKLNGGFVSSSRWFAEGYSYYTPFRRSYAGVNEQGEALYWVDKDTKNTSSKPGVNKDYTTTKANEASYYTHDNMFPAFTGGFGLTASYKWFDLSVNFDYQLGGKIYDTQYASLMSPDADGSNGYTIHKDYLKSWNPNNTRSDIPRWQYNDQYTASASDRFLTDASYLNFQSVNFGFTTPKKWLNKLGLTSLRLYVAGENLGFISARQGLDPRVSFASQSSMTAYNQAVRNISGGIQLSF